MFMVRLDKIAFLFEKKITICYSFSILMEVIVSWIIHCLVRFYC